MSEIAFGVFADLPADEPYPGVIRQVVDGEGATATRYEFRPRATFPLHRHPQEQITLVHRGAVRMALGGTHHELTAGGYSVVPGGVEHGITAGPDGAIVTAVVVPRRARPDAYEEVAP